MSETRQPRGAVKINGTVIDGCTEFEIHTNSHYEADTFTVKFPVRVLPDGFKIDDLVAAATLKTEIFAGFPANADKFDPSELKRWILGNVDDLAYDPFRREITLSGRDYTSLMIDTKTTEKYPNKTASEVATIIAQSHGLKPVVTATTELVGKFYEIDHVQTGDARTEWDLLTWLANQSVTDDGRKFTVYVSGDELHFEPSPAETDDPVKFEVTMPEENWNGGYPEFDGTGLQFSRNLTVLKDVVVEVRSWNSKNKKAFTAVYPSGKNSRIKPGEAEAKKQVYSYSFPGLTQEEALKKAQAIHHDITQHQVKMDFDLPADNDLTPRRVIKVTGTGTVFDQVYFPASVTRHFSEGGYVMSGNAKNHSPESDPQL